MTRSNAVAGHYATGELLAAITAGFAAMGKSPGDVTIQDLAPVDEFHVGGRQASSDFVSQLAIDAGARVLDIGCGIGGPARYIASTRDCQVSGIDLTPEYVETGQALTGWTGLSDKVTLQQANALDMPFDDNTFTTATLFHVGMNIKDKSALFAEAARVLKPGATFGIYDIMRTADGPLAYPVPWATTPEICAIATPPEYHKALRDAGFEVTAERDRRDFAAEFFATLAKRAATANGPPPIGLHIVLGHAAKDKITNMVKNIADGLLSPVELIARKR